MERIATENTAGIKIVCSPAMIVLLSTLTQSVSWVSDRSSVNDQAIIQRFQKLSLPPVNAFEYYTVDPVTRKKIYTILSGILE